MVESSSFVIFNQLSEVQLELDSNRFQTALVAFQELEMQNSWKVGKIAGKRDGLKSCVTHHMRELGDITDIDESAKYGQRMRHLNDKK